MSVTATVQELITQPRTVLVAQVYQMGNGRPKFEDMFALNCTLELLKAEEKQTNERGLTGSVHEQLYKMENLSNMLASFVRKF